MLVGLCLASLARGYSGFGFSAVLIASWSLITDPARAIAVTVLLEITASIIQAFSVWKQIPWKRVLLLMGGAVPGMLFGVYVLTTVPVDTLKLIVAVFVLISAILLSMGWKLKARANSLGTFAVGIASGAANGSIGMGGLPVALFLTADGDSPAALALPVLLIGMFLGTRHFLGATPEGFRRVTLFMLMGIAIIGIIRTLLS